MHLCLSFRDSQLPISPFRRGPRPGAASLGATEGAAHEDWAWLPPHILDVVAANLTTPGVDAASELMSLYAMAGTCKRWRSVALPMVLQRMWRGKPGKLMHPNQLFTCMPKLVKPRSRSQPAPMVTCILRRRPALSALDSPVYELWQTVCERDPSPRFLLAARMTSSCHFAISLARQSSGSSSLGLGGGSSGSSASWRLRGSSSSNGPAPDMECAELVTNMKRTEYELWACPKPWVTRALGDLAAVCGGSIEPAGTGGLGMLGGVAWLRKLLHLSGSGAAALDETGPAAAAAAAAGCERGGEGTSSPLRATQLPRKLQPTGISQAAKQQQHPLVQIHYYMRMHGLLLPRRLVVEVAQPPQLPAHMASNPLFDRGTARAGSTSKGAMQTLGSDVLTERDQGHGHSGRASSSGAVSASVSATAAFRRNAGASASASGSGRIDLPGTIRPVVGAKHGTEGTDVHECGEDGEGGPTWLRLQNLLPHWSPQLKCWCLNFNNRVKLPSIKNFQLGVCAEGRAQQQQGHAGAQATARMPMAMQFGKVDEDAFVLDFDPTAMSALQAFALGLSSFERKYALY